MKLFAPLNINNNQELEIDLFNQLERFLSMANYFITFLSSNLGTDTANFLQEVKKTIQKPALSAPLFLKDKYLEKSDFEKNIIAHYLQLISFENKNLSLSNKDIVKIKATDFLRGFLLVHASLLECLAKVVGKNIAIDLFKECIDLHTKEMRNHVVGDSLDIFLLSENNLPQQFIGAFDAKCFDLKDGRVGAKITKCKFADILSEVKCPEFAYAIACHYDFIACRCSNPNFYLTRTKALTKGDLYCDFIWHDVRINKSLEHPSEKFFNNL